MLESVLIANRGEIACRIIRTCRRLGIRSIAVYSDADAGALHVAMADARQRIGPAEAARSYLRPEAIIAAAQTHGAAAIHPGYGFLSERVELAELCAAHDIVWVGPSPRCIAAMGSKIESKILAQSAGVAGVPGYLGADQSEARLRAEAAEIGFPLLIKASAGGGGKGMRRVDAPVDFAAALTAARREAMAAFGDDRVLLERFIARPRHLEVQLAGDLHGNVVHLFERECSIQRNYQKLVEEAPAAHLPPAVRARLLEAAVRLGRAIGYESLGTVEFILEAGGEAPYFLEMNTRLQVEHPVTEAITGLDLVELQLRIAAGEALPFTQDEVRAQGAAIEVRLNAEDPGAGYRPQLGRVLNYTAPLGEGVRADSGVGAGSEVTPYYDSLLLKLIGSGADRAQAAQRLRAALDRLVLLGVGSNQAFLRDILRSRNFAEAVLTTGFLAETFPGGWQAAAPEPALLARAAAARVAALRGAVAGPWTALAGFRTLTQAGLPGRCRMSVLAESGEPVVVDVLAAGAGYAAEIDGRRFTVDLSAPQAIEGDHVWLFAAGRAWSFTVRPLLEAMAERAERAGAAGSDVTAPMPGLVTALHAAEGQVVRKGEVLAVMEAMKLVLSLPAPADGTVRAVPCRVGQTVAGGAVLVAVTPTEE